MSEITTYVCVQCKAEDSDRGPASGAPAALICWNCKTGRGMTPTDQVMRGAGMLPTHVVEQLLAARA